MAARRKSSVFDAIARNARRILGTRYAAVFMRKDDMLELAALDSDAKFLRGVGGHGKFRNSFPQPIDYSGVTGKALRSRKVVQMAPIIGNRRATPRAVSLARSFGYNAQVVAPLLRNGKAIGAIGTVRAEGKPFTGKELLILEAFADQAVIAIENVRLFNETREALDQQKASGNVLSVIASSPTDLKPVFETILDNALRLCDGQLGLLNLWSGNSFRTVAQRGARGAFARWLFERGMVKPATYSTPIRMLREKRSIQLEDLRQSAAYQKGSETAVKFAEAGVRTYLTVPMLKDGEVIGAIVVYRSEVRPFTGRQIALLETFASQAVIAMENARLFNETKEALERQTATSEILKVISSSTTDTQPVFEAIVRSAARLFPTSNATLFMRDGELIRLLAFDGETVVSDGMRRELAGIYPIRFDPEVSTSARAMVERRINICLDTEAPDVPEHIRRAGRAGGFRSNTVVPLVREDEGIGTLVMTHPQPGHRLDGKQLALLRTFADQAVIAIENVRLFNETREALERQTATADILRVIAGSPADVQPVFDAIVTTAKRLIGAFSATVTRVGDGKLNLVAHTATTPEGEQALKKYFPIPVEATPMGRAILSRQPQFIDDFEADTDDARDGRDLARVRGFRSVAFVPLVRGDVAIGSLNVTRREPGRMTDHQIGLLKTFADQAVIAIENVRLFNETKEALERQIATAEVLRVISGSPTDVQPVFDAIVRSCFRLFRVGRVTLWLVANGRIEVRARAAAAEEKAGAYAHAPLDHASGVGRCVVDCRMIHVPDMLTATDELPRARQLGLSLNYRAALFAPLVRDGKAIGAMSLLRPEPGPFSEREIALLQTFADQAVIAIENVRLFQEIQDKTRQLEIANKHKSEFLANMSHELRTPLNAIIGFSEVLIERMFGEVNEKQADYLKDIHESGRHLLSLINDILDLSKIEAGRMELELSSFHLPGVISNAMTLVRERAQRHGVQLASEIDPRLGELQADERKVKQILLNLLSNAVKFTPDGGRVDVTARLDTDRVEIAVKDSGVGIAPEDQARLFEEFRQVGGDAARKAEGTGLGLALTRKFVELHGGAIRVESAPGKGSTFSFSLPLAAAGRPASTC